MAKKAAKKKKPIRRAKPRIKIIKKKAVKRKPVKARRKAVKRKPAKKKTVRKTARKKTARKAAPKSVKKTKNAAPKKPAGFLRERVAGQAAKPVKIAPAKEPPVGTVIHYYSHLSVAVVRMDRGHLDAGDTIHIKGHTTDFKQRVESMEVEHERIPTAVAGQEFGLKVMDHAREHDQVFKVV